MFMEEPMTKDELAAIVAALSGATSPARPWEAQHQFNRIAAGGWASPADIEDVLYAQDRRLDDLRSHVSVTRWCKLYDIPTVAVFERPKARQQTSVGALMIRAADAADLLIRIERLGFSVDPRPLVDLLLPGIRRQAKVTSAELHLLHYLKTRHKHQSPELSLEPEAWSTASAGETFRTATGYAVTVFRQPDGAPIGLTVRAPKFRRRPDPKPETCPVCGVDWFRGDPDSSAAHRREHKVRLLYLDPQPLPELLAEIEHGADPTMVVSASPRWKHREMYRRAAAFRREFGYDFVQWHSPSSNDDPDGEGVLFLDGRNVIVGACAFQRRRNDAGDRWIGLRWIWFAPRYRRAGMLTAQWPALRQRFGDFHVEGPVSEAMQAFLTKAGDERLMSWPPAALLREGEA
jgi:hypothetical protein